MEEEELGHAALEGDGPALEKEIKKDTWNDQRRHAEVQASQMTQQKEHWGMGKVVVLGNSQEDEKVAEDGGYIEEEEAHR